MFESTNQEILASLRDFIGDALAESDITPSDILEAIQDELKELIDYHKIQEGKATKLLGMMQTPEDVMSFSERFREIVNNDNQEDERDIITFGSYDDFKLNSDYLGNPYMLGGDSPDTISFNLDDNIRKNPKKNKKNMKWGEDLWK